MWLGCDGAAKFVQSVESAEHFPISWRELSLHLTLESVRSSISSSIGFSLLAAQKPKVVNCFNCSSLRRTLQNYAAPKSASGILTLSGLSLMQIRCVQTLNLSLDLRLDLSLDLSLNLSLDLQSSGVLSRLENAAEL